MSIHQQQDADVISVSKSIQQLDKLSGKAFYDRWLAMQCSLLVGADFGVLLMKTGQSDGFQPVSLWPDSAIDMEPLAELVEEVIDQACGLITTLGSNANKTLYGLAYPVIVDEKIHAVIAVRVRVDDQKILKYTLQLLEWGCAWIELNEKRNRLATSETRSNQLSSSINILARILSEQTGAAAALRLVTELADVFVADRVTIGFSKDKRVKIEQVSHSISFDKRMNIIQCLEAAMCEAVDQHDYIQFPASDDDKTRIRLAHNKLHDVGGESQILTVPLYVHDDVVGAVTIERRGGQVFSKQDIQYCESICAIAASAIVEKRNNDSNIFVKISRSLKDQLSKLLGPGHFAYKLILILLVLTVAYFSTATMTYNLSADARVQGEITRAVVAPFDGYIDTAAVRAGDLLGQGDIIVSLDVRDYYLEKLRWTSEVAILERQRQEATARNERAAVNVLSAQLEQAEIQLDMVDMQIERAEIRAPFPGLIVNGDLSQRLGGAVSKGELLFEISPLDRYRVNLHIRESRIADVRTGQTGRLFLSALPERPFDFTVSRVTPINVSESGQTYFIVEAQLDESPAQLQVGMEGIGQIQIDERKIISIWTRDLVDWMRIQFWSWPI